MRYSNTRKYPITQMKKSYQNNKDERIIDLSLGTAVGLLAVIFLEGLFWGYMIRKIRH